VAVAVAVLVGVVDEPVDVLLGRIGLELEARIFLALVYICFSPVESPLSDSRMARLRTTSASS
jgi:hypothetical protein